MLYTEIYNAVNLQFTNCIIKQNNEIFSTHTNNFNIIENLITIINIFLVKVSSGGVGIQICAGGCVHACTLWRSPGLPQTRTCSRITMDPPRESFLKIKTNVACSPCSLSANQRGGQRRPAPCSRGGLEHSVRTLRAARGSPHLSSRQRLFTNGTKLQ